MSCIFENTLHYSSPGHGDWGVVRIGMLAPESIQLFVCPSACGRHGAIGAMKQGLKERLFYLYVSQSDIIDGYDGLIPGAVGEVLEAVSPRPKVFFLFVSCLDDLIGTDHDALLEELGRLHPDIQFRVCHMNPISLSSKTPPPVSIQNNLYSLLRPEKIHDSGINAVGNLEITAPSSELYGFLNAHGAASSAIFPCTTPWTDTRRWQKAGITWCLARRDGRQPPRWKSGSGSRICSFRSPMIWKRLPQGTKP